MWNWKLMHEDKDIICYCDIDSINDPVEYEEGLYSSTECYQETPGRVAAWMSFFIKNRDSIRQYIEQRAEAGLSIDGYEDFNNILCLVEIDSEKMLYRIIPALDYDSNDKVLSQSSVLDMKDQVLLKGMKGEWSPMQPRKTSKAIHALFRFIYVNHPE